MITIWFRGAPDGSITLRAGGDTFPSRDAFRSRSYRWDAASMQWIKNLPTQDAMRAEAAWIKADLPGAQVVRG